MSELDQVLETSPDDVNLFLKGIKVGEVGCIQLLKHMEAHGSTIRILELKGSTIGRRGAEYLAKGLKQCSALSHLGLGRNSLDYAAATTVVKALMSVPIETLDLEWNSLQDGVAQSIAELLQQSRTILALSLERNDIRSEGIVALANALTQNSSLQNLNLAFNRCGTAACEALGNMLEKNETLLTLNLMQCSVTTDAARHLCRGLSANVHLQSLNLMLNQAIDAFSGRTAGGTVKYHIQLSPSLRDLNLGGNRITSAFVAPFAEMLSRGTGLVGLCLGKCLIGEQVPHVLRSVALLTRLVTLDVSGCLISSVCGDLLAEILSRCPNLGRLFLDDNSLGRFGVEGLSAGLPFALSLTTLSLSRVNMGKEGMVAFAAALRNREGLPLRELRLAGNDLGYDGSLTLCDAMVNMRNDASRFLEVLDLSENDIGGRSCSFLAAVLQAHRNSLLSITLHNNPISEEMKTNYLTFEAALAYTGGIVSDPTLKINSSAAVKGTFEMDKAHRKSIANGGGGISPDKAQHPSPSLLAPSAAALRGCGNHRYSNFNGSSAGAALEDGDAVRAGSSTSPSRRGSVSPVDRSLQSPPSGPRHGAASPSPNKNSGPQDASWHPAALGASVYAPGLTPIVPQFKQRHQLHRVEENISQFPITDTQLRAKFMSLDASCLGYLSVPVFVQAYRELDAVALDVSAKQLLERVNRICPDGRVTYPRFCTLMLHIVNQ